MYVLCYNRFEKKITTIVKKDINLRFRIYNNE